MTWAVLEEAAPGPEMLASRDSHLIPAADLCAVMRYAAPLSELESFEAKLPKQDVTARAHDAT